MDGMTMQVGRPAHWCTNASEVTVLTGTKKNVAVTFQLGTA